MGNVFFSVKVHTNHKLDEGTRTNAKLCSGAEMTILNNVWDMIVPSARTNRFQFLYTGSEICSNSMSKISASFSTNCSSCTYVNLAADCIDDERTFKSARFEKHPRNHLRLLVLHRERFLSREVFSGSNYSAAGS